MHFLLSGKLLKILMLHHISRVPPCESCRPEDSEMYKIRWFRGFEPTDTRPEMLPWNPQPLQTVIIFTSIAGLDKGTCSKPWFMQKSFWEFFELWRNKKLGGERVRKKRKRASEDLTQMSPKEFSQGSWLSLWMLLMCVFKPRFDFQEKVTLLTLIQRKRHSGLGFNPDVPLRNFPPSKKENSLWSCEGITFDIIACNWFWIVTVGD